MSDGHELQIEEDMKIIFFYDARIISLYFLKYVGGKYRARGSTFGHIFGRSRNQPKSIATDQESLISNFGISKTP